MTEARFRFHGALAGLLVAKRTQESFSHVCARAATLKNAIEALGVPHTEIGALLVNDREATLDRIVRDGDLIEVQARGAEAAPESGFVADAHLGGLARFLRMLGYDTSHRNDLDDVEIRRLANDERRVVLTRDRELLKCREIARGCFVRALKAEEQLREVAARYRLAEHARPFTRCLHCNLPLVTIDKASVIERLPERVREIHERFVSCPGCGRVFWEGTHYQRRRAVLQELRPYASAPAPRRRPRGPETLRDPAASSLASAASSLKRATDWESASVWEDMCSAAAAASSTSAAFFCTT